MEDASRATRGAAAGGGASVVSQHSSRSHRSHRTIPAVVGGGNSVQSIPKGQLSGLISRYKTDTEDGAFASFLSEFEGLLK